MRHTSTPSIPSSPVARLTGIAQARRAVLHQRTALSAGWIAPWIEHSWQRCLSLGLRPHDPVAFDVISRQQIRHTIEANERLVRTAKPVLENLGRTLANTHYFAILTNADGVVVDVGGAIDRSDPRADNITRIGADLSERSVGTTAIGAALTDLQAVWLHRGEHFFEGNSHYSCAGAPLFGPDGACVGMLDLTGIDAVERPELKHLVVQSACRIENALLLAQARQLMLRLNWPGNAMGSEADGIVCLDAEGWITGANRMARQMVASLAPSSQPAVHASDVFALPFELLFDAVRRTDVTLEIPLWSGLRLQVLPLAWSAETQPLRSGQPLRASDSLPLREVEVALIHKAVEQARGNVAQAARALGISRATVYRKLGNPK